MKNTNQSKLLTTIKYFKPKLYKKMIFTGRLFEFLIRNIQINNEDVSFDIKAYKEAAYLCNIGFLALDEFIYSENFNKKNSFELIKEHVSRSVDYLENNNFENIAKIVKLHHELPNGMGYFKIQHQDKFLAYLNIADEYIELTIDYYKNTPLQIGSVAGNLILSKYKNTNLIQKDELLVIETDLNLFYERYILNV